MSPNFDNEEKEGTDDSEILPKRGRPKVWIFKKVISLRMNL